MVLSLFVAALMGVSMPTYWMNYVNGFIKSAKGLFSREPNVVTDTAIFEAIEDGRIDDIKKILEDPKFSIIRMTSIIRFISETKYIDIK